MGKREQFFVSTGKLLAACRFLDDASYGDPGQCHAVAAWRPRVGELWGDGSLDPRQKTCPRMRGVFHARIGCCRGGFSSRPSEDLD